MCPLWLFALSNRSISPGHSFVDDICVPRGCVGCLIQASPEAVVLLVISESLGAVGAVESFVTRDSSSLIIFESLWAVWAVCHP